jgi:hypothetical protein
VPKSRWIGQIGTSHNGNDGSILDGAGIFSIQAEQAAHLTAFKAVLLLPA